LAASSGTTDVRGRLAPFSHRRLTEIAAMHISRKWLIYGLAWTPFLLTLFFLMHASGAH
jgi:hypothetical protein